jgi:hypothetical protein
MSLKDLITPGACETTQAGWIWYCDDHITHGNADSAEEAEHIASAHAEWYTDANYMSYLMDKEEGDDDEFDADEFDSCDIYLINVNINKTFAIGEDYTDETPNVITDLEAAQAARQILGLP